MNFMLKKTLAGLLVTHALSALAGSGPLFNVTSSGAALGQTVSFNLCLNINGKNALSCQIYSSSRAGLSIKTTIPHHAYHYAGIKINTPGYVYATPQGLVGNKAKQAITASGYTPLGTLSDTQSANGALSSGTTGTTTYPRIYVETNNSLVTYSPDNGATWGVMLSPQGGWFWQHQTWATATTTDGTMYQATGVEGTAATLIYSSDGITWAQVTNPLPTTGDWVQSVFAIGSTVYVGTGNGYVYYTADKGATWSAGVTPGRVVAGGSIVNAIVVDGGGNYYAGAANGTIYYSQNEGASWAPLATQPTGGGAISSLAIDTNDALYAVTANTTTQPQYNTAPLTGGAWQLMSALPGGNGNAKTIAASGTTVYVGTSSNYVVYTSNKGANWSEAQLPSGDTSGISALFVNQSASLSPLFVESYGTIQITSGAGTGNIIVKNLSGTTASNVEADPNQLPAGVTQTSPPCTSVAPGATCIIGLSAMTSAFAPKAFNIIDSNGDVISRSALVSSVTSNGTNYYYVYNISGGKTYVVDSTNASRAVQWGSNGAGSFPANVSYDIIPGIDENSTSTVGSPLYSSSSTSAYSFTNMYTNGALDYTYSSTNPFDSSTFSLCNGAIDGVCNQENIHAYYNVLKTNYNYAGLPPFSQTTPSQTLPADYAAGLCYSDTNGSAAGTGQWHLPAACELNGGIYFNTSTLNFVSCTPMLTSIFSLYSLGALGGNLKSLLSEGFYWSSTEYSVSPQKLAWYQDFNSGGGSSPYFLSKRRQVGVRCSRALSF